MALLEKELLLDKVECWADEDERKETIVYEYNAPLFYWYEKRRAL